MSRIIQEDAAVGYSSEPDEDDSDHVRDIILTAEPNEIYVGNTGPVSASKFYDLFKYYGYITDMSIWRTHNHLYHARIVYRGKASAERAIESRNGKIFNGKRLRVSRVSEKIQLEHRAALRIDDLCAECSEEDIYEHFGACGTIQFVIKTGSAAYVQFATVSEVTRALAAEKILMGDPCIFSRISPGDRVDHVQVIENLKDIKYKKPFVMVENYPQLEPELPLKRYKADFERVGSVRHFKIAPTPNDTVTLALCMEKAEHRNLVIDRFGDTIVRDKVLKLYMAPGKARMTIDHAARFALSKTSIVVIGFPPYYKDYDVCKVFRRCGEINFLERFEEKWMICFESQAAVSLARYFRFVINRVELVIKNLEPATMPGKTLIKLRDYEAEKQKEEEKSKRNYLVNAFKAAGIDFKKTVPAQNPPAAEIIPTGSSSVPSTTNAEQKIDAGKAVQAAVVPAFKTQSKTGVLSDQAKHIASLFKKTDVAVSKVVPTVTTGQGAEERLSNTIIELSDDETNDPCPHDYKAMKNRGIFIGNLPKGVEESDIRQLFPGKNIEEVLLYCSKDSYHPTAAAYVSFGQSSEANEAKNRNHILFRGKRLIVKRSYTAEFFLSAKSLMLKNLDKNIDEEVILKEVQKVLGLDTVEDVHKPAYHYAYLDLKDDYPVNVAVIKLREAFTRFKIDVYPLQKSVPKRWILSKASYEKPIKDMRKNLGLRDQSQDEITDSRFGPNKANQLFVGNIPRDSQAEDLIQYFNNYGTVTDYKPIEEKSCYLRKSVFLSFINSKHAENVYRQYNHYFEGSLLSVHQMNVMPLQFEKDASILTIKYHSPFLTCDEIYHVVSQYVVNAYSIRFDAYDDRANLIMSYRKKGKKDPLESLQKIEFINDEAVLFVGGLDLTHPKPDEAREPKNISQSRFRKQKEKYLSYVVYKENLKDDMDLRTKPIDANDVPYEQFYNYNSVQINNVSLDTTMEQLRDFFWKCGDMVDYRALVLEEDATKICYVKFDVDLAADLACTYNQRILDGKRILVHLVKEYPHVERDRCVIVDRLSSRVTTEQIFDEFSQVGTLKYVQKQSPRTAIVCFKHKDCVIDAFQVTRMPHSPVVVNPCCQGYDPLFFKKFSVREEFFPVEQIQVVLKPRIRPEYHQLEQEHPSFDTLAVDVKAQLIEDVFMLRQNIHNFNDMTKVEQITELHNSRNFPHKAYFVKLATNEQEKLLEITETLQREAKNQSDHPTPAKQARLDVESAPSHGNGQSSGPLQHAANSFPPSGQFNCPPDPPPWSRSRGQMPPHSMFPGQGPSHRTDMMAYGNNMMRPMGSGMMPMARNTLSGHWEQQMASMAHNNSRHPGPYNFNRPPYY